MQKLKTDIAIIGGGVAGSAAATMLGRSGHDAILIDPHKVFPNDFRCEKFNLDQVATLTRMELADTIFKDCTAIDDVWIARYGYLLNKLDYPHYGFSYETVINALRKGLPEKTQIIHSKVKEVSTSKQRQNLVLANGTEISARLIIMANGLNPGLRKQLGIKQEVLSKNHIMSIGFDISPATNNKFKFGSLTCWPGSPPNKMAYFTAFKCRDTYRANMFGYWTKDDTFMNYLQNNPEAALKTLVPKLESIIGSFSIDGRVHTRPTDLLQNYPGAIDGVVFVGDAFSTSCPGAGTGVGKALVDIEQLCTRHIPGWLKNESMHAEKINSFYKDAKKTESDNHSFQAAYFLRSITMEGGFSWSARRWTRFLYHLGRGAMIRRQGLSLEIKPPHEMENLIPEFTRI